MIDLSVCMTAHSETVVAGPTLHSIEAAIAEAEKAGFSVERRLCLDAATPECREYFKEAAANWITTESNYRDQGAARNLLVTWANGRFIAFMDADDLCSENWFVEGIRKLRQAEEEGVKLIVQPELRWFFDGAKNVFVNVGSKDPIFTPYYAYVSNPYDALCMAPAAAFREHPYPARHLDRGFAYEDWQWVVETMAAGWEHLPVLNTVIFKRRRQQSQTTEAGNKAAMFRQVEPMAIDRAMHLSTR